MSASLTLDLIGGIFLLLGVAAGVSGIVADKRLPIYSFVPDALMRMGSLLCMCGVAMFLGAVFLGVQS